MQICIQLSAILTKLHVCRIKRDHSLHTDMFKMFIGRNARWHFLTFFSKHFFQNSWELLVQILHTYYTFLSTLDHNFLSNYLQL